MELSYETEEKGLIPAEQKLQGLIDTVDGIVWEADPCFRFTLVSRQAERLLGYPLERWLREPGFWAAHVHPADREWAIALCKKATQECRPHEFEYRMIAADGRVVWLRDIVSVIADNGRPLRLRGIMVDVTAQHRDREELERARREQERLLHEAQEAVHLRDDFLSIAAHELKTPLTPLKLHLQTLKRQLDSGQPVGSGLLDKAISQVGRLTVLINDLLDASRVEAGRLDLECAPLVFPELVREVVSDFRPVFPDHTFESPAPPEQLLVHGDRGRLAQVLTNLLENAVKYSPMGGEVRVTLEKVGRSVVTAVKDPGIGIPVDQQAQLFARFFRARNAPISGFGGLGLGLYICRDIVERHGGRIWVESAVGRGSTFRFSLPLLLHPKRDT
jgi:PAS domain S-box-containing protein